jgi:hypothetical protein
MVGKLNLENYSMPTGSSRISKELVKKKIGSVSKTIIVKIYCRPTSSVTRDDMKQMGKWS